MEITATNLVKNYGRYEVLKNCTLSVASGRICCILGKNGAGKTTFLKLLACLAQPSMGQILYDGYEARQSKEKILKSIGTLIETPIFYEQSSAYDNLDIHLDYMGIKDKTNIDKTLKMVGLVGVGDLPVENFSLGMRQRLGIARALVHKPEVLILDEPINGLDPIGAKEIRDLVISLAEKENKTIIVTSHILSEVELIADDIYIMDEGKIVKAINREEIKDFKDLENIFIKTLSGGDSFDKIS